MPVEGFIKRWKTIKRRIFKTIMRGYRAAQPVSEGTRFSCYNCVNIVQSVRLLIIKISQRTSENFCYYLKYGTDLKITGKTANLVFIILLTSLCVIPKDHDTMTVHNTNFLLKKFYPFYYIHFEITGDPCKLIGSLSEIKRVTIFKSLLLFKFLWNED